jgi:peroxiredoxin
MTTSETRSPVAPGEPAPNFTLPAVDRNENVSLADYRGRSPVFLALLVGLWCPFCRRQIAQIGSLEGKLKSLGVESLAVVATPPENARLYFKFRPTKVRLASDPELSTHRAYGIPRPAVNPEFMEMLTTVKINPEGVLPQPLPIIDAATEIGRLDGYAQTKADQDDMERQWPQLKGQFMIDRDGIVRWANIECAGEGIAGVGKFPPEETILSAARGLPGR